MRAAPYPGIAICFQPRQERPSFFISELRGVFSKAHFPRLDDPHAVATNRASESREPDFRNGAKKQRPLRFTPETASIHSITIQLLKRYAGSSHLST